MSCDIHPHHPHMLVVGLYDGSVAVYNLQQRMNGAPNYMSSATNGKHTDVVWQVSLLMWMQSPEHLVPGEVGEGQPGRLPQLLLRVRGRAGDQLDPGEELPVALGPADDQLCQAADQPCRTRVGQVPLPFTSVYNVGSHWLISFLCSTNHI